MKVVNFWKTLFCAALAVTAFSACSDDDEEGGYSGMPEITVNGGESVTVAGKLEGGKLEQTVEVVSKGDWTLTFKNPGDSQWVTPSAMSGKTGTTQLTFTLGQASAERSAILVLTASSTVEGFPLTDEATITVVQSDSDVPTGNALYSENCGTKVEKVDGYWPYVDKFEGWTRGGSLDQKAVTYTGNSASVANSGKVFDPAEDETTVVSGPPYVSMNKSTSVFNINDINIASNTNFTFTFTAAQQINYSNGVVLGDMTDETIRFSVSTDGSSYAPVALKVKKVASGYWYLCTAEFKLPAGVSTDKIWVRFDGYAGLENHGLRIDDFKLYEGGNGSELVVPSVDYTKGTVAEAIAAGAGKKAGEFYTPQEVSQILAEIVITGKQRLKTVFDPTCGSGSLLLRTARSGKADEIFGQEKNPTTFNLCRMNMLLHGIRYNDFDIRNGDTLEADEFGDRQFDAVVANPPFSADWSAADKFNNDDRFNKAGVLAPKSKADYAFILHMIYHLNDGGTMACVAPHGVLFRGAAEGKIRRFLIEKKNYIDAIIGLPANIFYGTSIPTCILVMKKCRKQDDNILFIDASREFEKVKTQNKLRPEHIQKIIETYRNRSEIGKYSHCATLKEIEENDYNLNIPRYVDTFEEEEPIDIKAVMAEIKELEAKRADLDKQIEVYLKELDIIVE